MSFSPAMHEDLRQLDFSTVRQLIVQCGNMPERLAQLLRQCRRYFGHVATPAAKRPRKIYDVSELRDAIDNGEFVNYYQPKVALPRGEWIGVETLVRWKHPTDGLVLPEQFIPTAEAEVNRP